MKRIVIALLLALGVTAASQSFDTASRAPEAAGAARGAQARPGGQARPALPQSGMAGGTLPAEVIQKKVEAYLRKLYAWGPSFQVRVGTPTEAELPGFYQVSLEVTLGSESNATIMHISKDGRYLIPGDVLDASADPFAANRKQLLTNGRPSTGPANAPVTVVEFIDFQCPHCRQLDRTLRELRPQYPQVRFVIKNFPLTQIHPWAMTGAIAAECAFRQDPQAFWKLHDALFDDQDTITPRNAWEKMLAFAQNAGLDQDTFRACMASPEAKQAVDRDIEQGKALRIANTPTLFINGRRTLTTDPAPIKQFLDYELSTAEPQNGNPNKP